MVDSVVFVIVWLVMVRGRQAGGGQQQAVAGHGVPAARLARLFADLGVGRARTTLH